uniref:Uncharacterized protein n=1 Tax=Nelumbo nucifera TaxID=4432 RepID=A0A822XHE5_NELNU|nr:TPA_asm: hypothetical protein HUJ06_019922 [Nelumbo nucifera]
MIHQIASLVNTAFAASAHCFDILATKVVSDSSDPVVVFSQFFGEAFRGAKCLFEFCTLIQTFRSELSCSLG